jgi:alanine racemase
VNRPSIAERAWLDVDLGALVRNARALATRAGVPLLPMVKADAYGLGAAAVTRALEVVDPWGYGVATVAEGVELRQLGIARPIIVFTPPLPSDFTALRDARLTPALGDPSTIGAWIEAGGGAWHLAINTGMNRSGVRWDALASVLEAARRHPPEGAFTHFHSAELDDGSTAEQLRRFRGAIALLPTRPALLHVENSPAIERLSGRSEWSMVRPGVFLYGVASGGHLPVEPVVALRAPVVEVRTVAAGESVSYDATWIAPSLRRIGTIAAGYADGYRRSLSNVGEVWIGGALVPVVGIVTMDMTMIDVTDVPCAVGDEAVMVGAPGPDLASVARRAGLSTYELLVGFKLRAPRVYRGIPAVGAPTGLSASGTPGARRGTVSAQ